MGRIKVVDDEDMDEGGRRVGASICDDNGRQASVLLNMRRVITTYEICV